LETVVEFLIDSEISWNYHRHVSVLHDTPNLTWHCQLAHASKTRAEMMAKGATREAQNMVGWGKIGKVLGVKGQVWHEDMAVGEASPGSWKAQKGQKR
jgi:hypothetical protein